MKTRNERQELKKQVLYYKERKEKKTEQEGLAMDGRPCIRGAASTPARHGGGRRGGRAHMSSTLIIVDQDVGRGPSRLLLNKSLHSAVRRPSSASNTTRGGGGEGAGRAQGDVLGMGFMAEGLGCRALGT